MTIQKKGKFLEIQLGWAQPDLFRVPAHRTTLRTGRQTAEPPQQGGTPADSTV
jgi:hypothetical protein